MPLDHTGGVLARLSQPGQAAAVSGDRGLKQMAWLNQGGSSVLGSVLVCVCSCVRESVCAPWSEGMLVCVCAL